jgi:electron-transferring-flavoprotein dehydrogenase
MEREVLEVDVLVVGAGPAGLAAALRLAQLQQARGGEPLSIAVLEKGRAAGAHTLSGAVLDLSTLRDLVPDFERRGAPVGCRVTHDAVYYLTARGHIRAPFVPPPLVNHDHAIVSLSALVKWLAAEVEATGVDLLTDISARDVIFDGTRVAGVRTGDSGLDRHGAPTAAFQPGVDVRAKVTIFCDGVRGNLTKTLVQTLHLDEGRLPQVYALGLKELWQLAPGQLDAGAVIHTLGYPLTMSEFGGGFIYGMPDGLASIGLVAGLDYRDPRFEPHEAFQRFKRHPFVAELLADATLVRFGAKALPEGGWHAVPRLHMDGALIAGDAGGFVNSLRLKGIHLAMRTGMLAAETAFDAVRAGDTSTARLASYQAALDAGVVKRELYPVRNVHQAFAHGLAAGTGYAGLALLTRGWWLRDPMPTVAGHERMRPLADVGASHSAPAHVPPDRQLTFDRATSVHYAGTRHREDEPSHLLVRDLDICRTVCLETYGNPCTRFCPAAVYEMVDDGTGTGGKRLQIHASNCVHCKTCDIMDPYQIIDWVPPEGGEGPQYDGL